MNRRLTIVITASSIAAAACDGAIRVHGRVVDAAGAPVSTARIQLVPTRDGRQFDASVASDGCFTLLRVVAPGRYDYVLRIDAPGFKSAEGTIPTIVDNRTVVVLRRVNEAARSSIEISVSKWPKNANPCAGKAAVQPPISGKTRADCDLFWQGRYRNRWGFQVTIPPGKKGYSNSPVSGCGDEAVVMGDHGLLIPLSGEPYQRGRHIEIDAGYNSLERSTASEAVDSRLKALREDSKNTSLQVLRRSTVAIAGLLGERLVVRYYHNELGQEMVEDALEFLRPGNRAATVPPYEFSIYLRTPRRDYERDKVVFETLLRSLRFTKPEK